MNALSPAEQTDTWLYTFEKLLTKKDANAVSKLFSKGLLLARFKGVYMEHQN